MRNANFYFVLVVGSLVSIFACETLAQSGSRSSSGRSNVRRSAPGGLPSRMGGARSKAVPTRARPTGMANSANAARMSGTRRPAGIGARPSTGLTPQRSAAPATRGLTSSPSYGALPPTTGLARPGRGASRPTGRSTPTQPAAAKAVATVSDSKGYRRWTDVTGRYSIKGMLAAERNGVVWIRRLDGKLARLGVEQLSKQDREFLSTP